MRNVPSLSDHETQRDHALALGRGAPVWEYRRHGRLDGVNLYEVSLVTHCVGEHPKFLARAGRTPGASTDLIRHIAPGSQP